MEAWYKYITPTLRDDLMGYNVLRVNYQGFDSIPLYEDAFRDSTNTYMRVVVSKNLRIHNSYKGHLLILHNFSFMCH